MCRVRGLGEIAQREEAKNRTYSCCSGKVVFAWSELLCGRRREYSIGMASFALSSYQTALERPIESKIFLESPAGAGKTTAGIGRLLHLLATGVQAGTILLIVNLEH